MDHSVLTILDLGIITAYLVIMVLVGSIPSGRIQNTKDYYVAAGPLADGADGHRAARRSSAAAV